MWEPRGCLCLSSLHHKSCFIIRAPMYKGHMTPLSVWPRRWRSCIPGEGLSFPGTGRSGGKTGLLFERVHDGSSLCGRVLYCISSVILKCDVLPVHWFLLQIASPCSSHLYLKETSLVLLLCYNYFCANSGKQNKISGTCYSWRRKYITCIIMMLYILTNNFQAKGEQTIQSELSLRV